MHGPQDAAVHWLQPVANVRERSSDDDGHCVVKIRASHLVFDVYVVTLRSGFHLTPFPVQSARFKPARFINEFASDFTHSTEDVLFLKAAQLDLFC
jgi:hypothetical protein